MLLRTIQGEDTRFFTLDRLRVRTEIDEDGGVCNSEATLAIRVQDARELVVAEGNGPVDALSNALRKALRCFYPDLDQVHLSDYKVRVLNSDDGTAAAVRVLVEHRDGERRWHTVGVSTNILEASWQALADGIRYYLLKKRQGELAASAALASAQRT
nr:alpha-isopropylmalate synthase regulatory domain-containing protein [Rhodothermus marinus]